MRQIALFSLIGISSAVAVIAVWIGGFSHRAIPPSRVLAEGDAAIAYDSEIGFVPRPNSASKRTHLAPSGKPTLQYHLYTDRLGARVSRPGEQTPDRVDLLTIGDSFTWGHGVENEQTFANRTFSALGVRGANLGLGSYATTHSLQMLRRNRALAPKLVIYSFNFDQPRRNVLACAPAFYPFCLDYSYVAWDRSGQPYIASPRGDGVTRVQRQVQSEKTGLDPLTWVRHDLDVAVSRITARAAQNAAMDTAKQEAALEYLIEQMVRTTTEMKAVLLIVYIPTKPVSRPPEMLVRLGFSLGYRFLDLSPAFASLEKLPAGPLLYLPNDSHPSAAGHALIAEEIVRFIQHERLLVQ